MNAKETDLNAVIASQDNSLRRLLGVGVSLVVERSDSAARVQADETMLVQILNSLLDHARESMPGGGGLTLRTEIVEVDDTHARMQPGARCGPFVRLTVSDSGRGLTADQLQTLFQECPARTAPRSGNSLPLALVAGIVKRRQGWIEASSHSGDGTTIMVYFPVATPGMLARSEAPWVGETILLVDDEVGIRCMVKSVLERASYEVIEADTGMAALSIWELHKERVKLLLTDMVMPDGLSGRGLAQRLRATKPSLRVIYTSGFALDSDAQQDTALGTVRFLQKPYDMRALLETVHEAMKQTERAGQGQVRQGGAMSSS